MKTLLLVCLVSIGGVEEANGHGCVFIHKMDDLFFNLTY